MKFKKILTYFIIAEKCKFQILRMDIFLKIFIQIKLVFVYCLNIIFNNPLFKTYIPNYETLGDGFYDEYKRECTDKTFE